MEADFPAILKARGFALLPDGSWARPDSEHRPAKAPPETAGKPLQTPAAPSAEPRRPSALELAFDDAWKRLGGPALLPEFAFHLDRKWRFDFAHIPSRVALELEGLTRGAGGRHQRKEGAEADMEKYFEATVAGWLVVRLCRPMLTDETLVRIFRLIALRAAERVVPPRRGPICDRWD
jgi:hypothetical protein